MMPPRSVVGSYTNCHSLYFFFLLNSRILVFLLLLATPTIGPLATSWLEEDESLEESALEELESCAFEEEV